MNSNENTTEYEKKKKKSSKIFRIVTVLFVILSLILAFSYFIYNLPKKELISTKTYDIYDFTIDDDYVYYTFIDEENKINKDYISSSSLLKILYLSDNNQITVEYLGYDGKISKVKIKKFHLTEETYEKFSEEFDWQDNYNM